MQDIIKKSILFGMGAVSYTKDSIEEYVQELSKEGINPEEGKRMVEDMIKKAEKNKDEQLSQIKELIKKSLAEMGVATKDDIAEVKKLLKK